MLNRISRLGEYGAMTVQPKQGEEVLPWQII
jgi:hypothetical protein